MKRMNRKERISDSQKTLHTAFSNTIANVISLVIGTLVVSVTTRVMSQDDVGTAATFLANRNTIAILVTFSIYAYVNRGLVLHDEDKIGFLQSVTYFCILVIFAAFIIALPFKQLLMNLLSLDPFLYYWLFVSLLSYTVFLVADYYCIYSNKSGLVFWIVIATGPIGQILSVIFAVLMPSNKYMGRVLGLDAAYVLVTLIFLIGFLFKQKRPTWRKCLKYIQESLSFTLPLLPHLLSQMLLTQCDLILISYLCGTDKSGIYSMGHTVGNLAFTVMTQIMCAWSPWVYRRMKENQYAPIKYGSEFLMALGVFLSCGLITVSPELVHLMLPSSYAVTTSIIPMLVFAMYFQFLFTLVYDLEYFRKKPHWIALQSSIAAASNVVLNILIIPIAGYQSACYLTCISYAILLLTGLAMTRKLDFNSIYNSKALLLSVIFMGGYSLLGIAVENNLVIRYLLMITVTCLLLYRYRNILNSQLKEFMRSNGQ